MLRARKTCSAAVEYAAAAAAAAAINDDLIIQRGQHSRSHSIRDECSRINQKWYILLNFA